MTPSLATRINAFGVLGMCFILLGAYYVQFVEGEFPCPLCLLQRLAMLGVAFGAMLNLRYGLHPQHYSISIISAIFGACVSMRQVLLHIAPGTSGYGSAVLGLHLYTWALIVFVVAIFLIAVMMFFEGQFEENVDNKSTSNLSWFIKAVFLLVLLIAAANVLTTFFECGIGQCPDNSTSYKELS